MSGIIFNDDFQRCVTRLYHAGYRPGEAGESDVRRDIRRFQNSQITDFIFNVNAQLSYSPSRLWQTAGDKYLKTVENGEPVNFKDSYLAVWHDLFVRQHVDIYAVWIDELRKMGIRPWMSFRLNDTHDNAVSSGGIRRSDYTYSARANALTRTLYREKAGYYDDCLNYARADVRNRMLAYIGEQLERYDTDGIELDWMREPFCFVPGEEDEGRDILNDFMRRVKDMALAAEKRRGHPVRIGVRVMRDPQNSFDAGLDVFTWAREGLIDWLVPTPRWETADSDMPITLWKRIFEHDGVHIAAGTDIRLMSRPDGGCVMLNPELISGLAMQYLCSGADAIYLFNYAYLELPALEEAFGQKAGAAAEAERAMLEPLSWIGDPDTLEAHVRRHVVSFQDIGSATGTLWRPLPMPLLPNSRNPGLSSLSIQTGRADGAVTLRLGLSPGLTEKDVEVYANGAPCDYLGRGRAALFSGDLLEYRPRVVKARRQIIEIKAGSGTLDYAEILVEPDK